VFIVFSGRVSKIFLGEPDLCVFTIVLLSRAPYVFSPPSSDPAVLSHGRVTIPLSVLGMHA
jgi:hypothetical protein